MMTLSCLRASPNLDIIGVKFDSKLTFEDHVRGIVSSVSERIGVLRFVKCVFVNTSVLLFCYYTFVLRILEYSFRCDVQLMNVTSSFSSVRCIQWPGFALSVSCHCIIRVMLLGDECCTK